MAWTGTSRRLVQLYIGLVIYGISSALLVRSRLGLDPWDVFHQGLAGHLGVEIGTVVIIVGAAVLLLWIPLRQRPGHRHPEQHGPDRPGDELGAGLAAPRAPRSAGGPPTWSSASCCRAWPPGCTSARDFGPGPRDGLMTGIARRSGRSIRLVRTCLEVSVLALGWLLGGTIGVGTVLYALAIGALSQLFLGIFDVRPAATAAVVAPTVALAAD